MCKMIDNERSAALLRNCQGHPRDLFLKIPVLHANFCWLRDVEEIIVLGRKVLLGQTLIFVSGS